MKRLGFFVNVSKILIVSALDLTGGLRPLFQWLRHQGTVRTSSLDRSAGERRGGRRSDPAAAAARGPGAAGESGRDEQSRGFKQRRASGSADKVDLGKELLRKERRWGQGWVLRDRETPK